MGLEEVDPFLVSRRLNVPTSWPFTVGSIPADAVLGAVVLFVEVKLSRIQRTQRVWRRNVSPIDVGGAGTADEDPETWFNFRGPDPHQKQHRPPPDAKRLQRRVRLVRRERAGAQDQAHGTVQQLELGGDSRAEERQGAGRLEVGDPLGIPQKRHNGDLEGLWRGDRGRIATASTGETVLNASSTPPASADAGFAMTIAKSASAKSSWPATSPPPSADEG
eukprot:CAMPEP_0179112110 /NCGR_PEP_ID=MMETSP0796-20121207/52392_1 /TAXON_ID=73915 /ORGANISM="Pyrodinium bahamense, Strain pbaha01" /LENGTH=219 /DNA_ID=CAMNT_0020810273 /DNA_START=116 /DNA_END=773 /DNA_ORIENTATION=-